MPLHPGPWRPSPGPLTSGTQQSDGTEHIGPGFTVYDPAQSGISTTDFDAMCEPIPPAAGVSATRMDLGNFGTGYALQQLAIDFNLTNLVAGLLNSWSPTLPWPPSAVAWEWDLAGAPAGDYMPSAHYVTGVTVTARLHDTASAPTDVTIDAVPADPTAVTYNPASGMPRPFGAIPGASLTPIVGAVAVPAASADGTLTTDPIDPAYIHDLTATGGTSLAAALRVVLAYDNQRTHVPPPAVTQRRMDIAGLLQTAVINWTPPRWRFLYKSLPPLRQSPRDDFLGGAPRQGTTNQSRSVQASSRQGWANNYR